MLPLFNVQIQVGSCARCSGAVPVNRRSSPLLTRPSLCPVFLNCLFVFHCHTSNSNYFNVVTLCRFSDLTVQFFTGHRAAYSVRFISVIRCSQCQIKKSPDCHSLSCQQSVILLLLSVPFSLNITNAVCITIFKPIIHSENNQLYTFTIDITS